MDAPDDPVACYRALMESVGYWTMSNINPKTLGGKPKPIAVFGRDGWTVSSSCGLHVTLGQAFGLSNVWRTSLWGTQWGQLDHGRPGV